MPPTVASTFRSATLILALIAAPALIAQQPATLDAPIPAQIASAKKVFISNDGDESNYYLVKNDWYAGGPNRAYNQFYAGMKSGGQYELVSAPADADLVFEILRRDSPEGATARLASIVLRIIDPKSRITLWTLRAYEEPAILPKNRERNYDLAITALLGDVKALVVHQIVQK
jgi:hypothetical protein